jgi:type I restriction enzyme M protein
VLFAEGVGGRIKKRLLDEFNLHTVVRLPNGTFAPYTLIPTNILFFEAGTPTRDIWFYEHPLPDGRKNYTKTKPLRYEEFAECEAWWGGHGRAGRAETTQAWKVAGADVAASGYNLDLRNPNRAGDLEHRPVAELVEDLVRTEEEILAVLRSLQVEITSGASSGALPDGARERA